MIRLIIMLFLIINYSLPAKSYSDSQRCRSQIMQLGGDLKIMLRKMNIMPPITKIYIPLKKAFDEAIRAQSRNDFKTCIDKTNIALKYSRTYAK
jgi:hypothetical protein